MSYTALYRKFRPDEFEDVKGQDAIVRTLKNQINADRIGRWKPVRGVCNVPVDRSWYIDECDRD